MTKVVDFKDAAKIKQLDSHTYEGSVSPEWAFNQVVQGGIALSLILSSVRTHFRTTHASLNQPDIVTVHAQYLRQVSADYFKVKIEDTKLGRAFSNVHAVLMNKEGEPSIAAYILQSNLTHSGEHTADTGVLDLWPKLPPKSDNATMFADKDPYWGVNREYEKVSPVLGFNQLFYPRTKPPAPGFQDRWLRLKDGYGRWTAESIAYAADMPGTECLKPMYNRLWLATLVLTIEYKKPVPEEGFEWLLCRTTTTGLRDAKYDFNTVMLDEQGELVAMSTQLMAGVDVKRRKVQGRKSKI